MDLPHALDRAHSSANWKFEMIVPLIQMFHVLSIISIRYKWYTYHEL